MAMLHPDRPVRPRQPALAAPLLCALLLLLAPRGSRAAGFEYPCQGTHALGRGCAFTAAADDPSAIYWNPAHLTLLPGTQLLYNQNLAQLSLDYDRAPTVWNDYAATQRQIPYSFGRASQQDGLFPMGLSLLATSDLGLKSWAFGFGMHGPTAIGKGSMGGVDTSTRYSFIDKDVLALYLDASAAWRHDKTFGFGASLQYARLESMDFRFVIITNPTYVPAGQTPNPAHTDQDMVAEVHMSDPFAMSGLAGAWVRPLSSLELAASGRVYPVYFDAAGDVTMRGLPGGLYSGLADNPIRVPAHLSMHFPVTAQAGVRWWTGDDDSPTVDVEADFVWENWSSLQGYKTTFDKDRIQLPGTEMRLSGMTLARGFQDSYSVRLGGQWQAIPGWFALRLGGLWESAALQDGYAVTDFPSFGLLGLTGGASLTWRSFELSVAYAHLAQFDRDVSQEQGRIRQQTFQNDGTVQQGAVVNAGHYESSYDIVSLGLGYRFGGGNGGGGEGASAGGTSK